MAPPEFVTVEACKELHSGTRRSITFTNWLISIFVTVLLAALAASAAAWQSAGSVSQTLRTHMGVQEEKDKHQAESLERIEKQVEKILLKMGGP